VNNAYASRPLAMAACPRSAAASGVPIVSRACLMDVTGLAPRTG
jgi:hypothetical protein